MRRSIVPRTLENAIWWCPQRGQSLRGPVAAPAWLIEPFIAELPARIKVRKYYRDSTEAPVKNSRVGIWAAGNSDSTNLSGKCMRELRCCPVVRRSYGAVREARDLPDHAHALECRTLCYRVSIPRRRSSESNGLHG